MGLSICSKRSKQRYSNRGLTFNSIWKFYESWITFSWINFNRSYNFWWDELGDIKSVSFLSSWGGDSFEAWSTIGPRLYSNWLSSCCKLIIHLTTQNINRTSAAFNVNWYLPNLFLKKSSFVFNSIKETDFLTSFIYISILYCFNKKSRCLYDIPLPGRHHFLPHDRPEYLFDIHTLN